MKSAYVICSLLSLHCGLLFWKNPPITYSLSPVQNTEEQKPKNGIIQTPPMELSIFQEAGVEISMRKLSGMEAAEYLILMQQYTSIPENARAPELLYILFKVKNQSKSVYPVHFFDTYFQDEADRKYAPYTKEAYESRFTSASYSLFQFERFFGLYVTKRNNITADKISYYSSKDPGVFYDLNPGEEAVQVVGYPILSSESRNYVFYATIVNRQFRIPFRLMIQRADRPEAGP